MADPSARITLVPTPVASPGCCAICGKNEHIDGFAATDNFDFEFYGTVYFCADCVGDYARVFDFISPSESHALKASVIKQAVELKMLRDAVVQLENTLDNLVGISDRRRDNIVPGDRAGNLLVGLVPTAISGPDESVEPGESDQLTLDESSDESGRDDVRDLTTDDSINELLSL